MGRSKELKLLPKYMKLYNIKKINTRRKKREKEYCLGIEREQMSLRTITLSADTKREHLVCHYSNTKPLVYKTSSKKVHQQLLIIIKEIIISRLMCELKCIAEHLPKQALEESHSAKTVLLCFTHIEGPTVLAPILTVKCI